MQQINAIHDVKTQHNNYVEINSFLIALLCALFLCCGDAFALEPGQARYKCHVEVNKEFEEIHWFIFNKTTRSEVEKVVAGRQFFASDGTTKLTISHVFECAAEGKRFAQLRARKLEAQTVF